MAKKFNLNEGSHVLIDRIGTQLDLAKQLYVDSIRNRAKQLAREIGIDISINLKGDDLEIKYEGKNERAQQAFAKLFEDIKSNSGKIFLDASKGILK